MSKQNSLQSKRLRKLERSKRKMYSMSTIPFYVVAVDRRAIENLMYLNGVK